MNQIEATASKCAKETLRHPALASNTTGGYNTASGFDALAFNTTGSSNIAVGLQAGFHLTTGSHNIDIGSTGVAAESDTIRIGAATQKTTFIAGIFGTSDGPNRRNPL